jgi:hypothetical protein
MGLRLVKRSKRLHVTVLYPFLPPAAISEPLLASPGALCADFAAFEFTLDRVGWFGETVGWLGPSDPASDHWPFRQTAGPARRRRVDPPRPPRQRGRKGGHPDGWPAPWSHRYGGAQWPPSPCAPAARLRPPVFSCPSAVACPNVARALTAEIQRERRRHGGTHSPHPRRPDAGG